MTDPDPTQVELSSLTAAPEPVAATAAEEDHEDPWVFASEEPADAPAAPEG